MTDNSTSSNITFNDFKYFPNQAEETAPRFPYEFTPRILADWIQDTAEIKSMPPDYIAVGLITSLATLIAGKTKVQPKRNDPSWLVTPNLWGMIIGRPSTMKSPALKLSLKYIQAFENQLRVENDDLLQKFNFDLMVHDAQEKIAKEQIKKTMKNRPGIDMEVLREQEGVIPKPELPQAKRLLTNDPTQEKLAELCSYNPEGILVIRDELTGWLRSLDRHDRSNDKAFNLEGWNGNVPYTTDRIGRGTQHIENLTLSVLGGTQPGVLNKYIQEAVSNQGGDGLLQRFQLMVYPDVVQEEGNGNFPNDDYQRSINKMFDNFYSLKTNDFDFFRFDEKGQKDFNSFEKELFKKTRSGDLTNVLEAHLGKYLVLYCSLALIFTLVEDIDATEINSKACEDANYWCYYLEKHAKRIYGSVEDPYFGARKIVDRLSNLIDFGKFIETSTMTGTNNVHFAHANNLYLSIREIQQKKWSGLKHSDEISKALDQLQDLGFVSKALMETQGRNKMIYLLNPRILEYYYESE